MLNINSRYSGNIFYSFNIWSIVNSLKYNFWFSHISDMVRSMTNIYHTPHRNVSKEFNRKTVHTNLKESKKVNQNLTRNKKKLNFNCLKSWKPLNFS